MVVVGAFWSRIIPVAFEIDRGVTLAGVGLFARERKWCSSVLWWRVVGVSGEFRPSRVVFAGSMPFG
jgi:hypothetical protein